MTDRPILFSAPMVRALLAGTKTQTRRLAKGVPDQPVARCHPNHQPKHAAPYLDSYCSQPRTAANPRGMSREWCWWQVDDRQSGLPFKVMCAPGDRLWVRETWAAGSIYDGIPPRDINPDGKPGWCGIRYAATDERFGIRDRVSIHMPRWASRLTLTITDVRVQRLCEISEEDAIAEGIRFTDHGMYQPPGEMSIDGGKSFHPFKRRQHDGWHWQDAASPDQCLGSASSAYMNLWNHINGDGAATANPWVVAYSFTVEHRNIDAQAVG